MNHLCVWVCDVHMLYTLRFKVLTGSKEFKDCSHSSRSSTGRTRHCSADSLSDWSIPKSQAELI